MKTIKGEAKMTKKQVEQTEETKPTTNDEKKLDKNQSQEEVPCCGVCGGE